MKSIIWLVGLGVVGFVAYEYFKGKNPISLIPGTTPASFTPTAATPPGYLPASVQTSNPVTGAIVECTDFDVGTTQGCPQVQGVRQCSSDRPYWSQCFQQAFSPADAQSAIDQVHQELLAQGQMPAGVTTAAPTPAADPRSGFYTTTNTGCPAFYSLADRSKCTKTPKAKKCQGSKIFDLCHAGWKTQAAADKIVAKLIGA